MAASLFIPKKIKVGYQERNGTFTGKLAYVTYYDEKNILRKEKSWEKWRDEKIEPQEFENTPMTGFIFNKGIQRSSEWFGSGRTVFRLYAPHDFEFEINGDNLINLLMHADVSKREILEPCVFAWAGAELILLPTNSVEYQESVKYTTRQELKVSSKELGKGYTYQQKKGDNTYIYIGHYNWWDFKYNYRTEYSYQHVSKGKKHIFYNVTNDTFEPINVSILSNAISTECCDNYANLVEQFFETMNSDVIASIVERPYVPNPVRSKRYECDRVRFYPDIYTFDTNNQTLTTYFFRIWGDLHSTEDKTSTFYKFNINNLMCDISQKQFMMLDGKITGYRNIRNRYAEEQQQTNKIKQFLISQVVNRGIIGIPSEEEFVDIVKELGYMSYVFITANGKEINNLNSLE